MLQMRNWLKKLNTLILKGADTKWGVRTMFLCAFADASFFPFPTTTVFIPLVLLNVSKAYKYAFIFALGTFSGAFAGYLIGHFAWLNAQGEFTPIAQFLFDHIPGFSKTVYNHFHIQFVKYDFWILIISAFLPFPINIFSISAGVFNINIFVFCLAILISMTIKFYFLAFMVVKAGPEIQKISGFKFKPVAIVAIACIVIAVIIVKTI
jgi:membrane protein YqaA with SNARE-associated domain